MQRHYLFLLILPVFLCQSTIQRPAHQTGAAKKWVKLFNGKNLNGWKVKVAGYDLGVNYGNTFRVANGILSVRYDQYDSFKNKFGGLWFDRKFTNYRLKLEYRFIGESPAPGGPSWGYKDGGIQYHCQAPTSMGKDQPFPVCLEYNLHGGNGKEDRPTGEICVPGVFFELNGSRNTAFCTLPTIKKTFTGEEWIKVEIDVRDGKVTHYVNGEEILHFENPRYDPKHAIAKTLIVNNDDRVKEGYISLQSNSHPLDFRKIEIMEY
jgi:hypothetical protein